MDIFTISLQVLLQAGLSNQSSFWSFISTIIWLVIFVLLFTPYFQNYMAIMWYSYSVGNFLNSLGRLITNNVNLVINHINQLLKSNGSSQSTGKNLIEKTIQDLMEFVVIEPLALNLLVNENT